MDIHNIVYTELDSLFDTKHCILYLLDERLADEYLLDKESIDDSYLYLSKKILNKIYRDRNKDILLNSVATNVLNLIRQYTNDFRKSKIDGMTENDSKLVVNTYPYKLTDKELDVFKEALTKSILSVDLIEFVYEKEILDIKGTISVMLKRDGLDWFIEKKKLNPNFNMRNTMIVVPDEVSDRIKQFGKDFSKEKLMNAMEALLFKDTSLNIVDKELYMLKID